MIHVDKKQTDLFLEGLANLISATSVFPRLQNELRLLQGIEADAKKLLGKDVANELNKLNEELNNGK